MLVLELAGPEKEKEKKIRVILGLGRD